MVRYECEHVFPFPPGVVWPVLSKTDWLNRSLGLPPVHYNIHPVAEGGSVVTASASVMGSKLQWRENPFEWLEPVFYRVHRVFHNGPFHEIRAGMDLRAEPGDCAKAVFYMECEPRGALGSSLARFLLGPKSVRDTRRVMAHAEEFLQGRQKIILPDLTAHPADSNALRAGFKKLAEHGQPDAMAQLLENFLRNSPDIDMAHIRPLAVARKWNQDQWRVLELFLHATRCGLLDLSWEVLCPNCRSSRQPPVTSLAQLKSAAHCDVCEIKFDAEFDKSVELKFSVNPAVRPVDYQTFCLAGPGAKPHIVSQAWLEPGAQKSWTWPSRQRPLRLQSPQVAASLTVWPDDLPAAPQRLVVVCEPGRFVLTRENNTDAADPADVRLVNPNPHPVLVGWHQPEWSEDILTAARVTNCQEFRDLFSSEVVSPSEQITIGAQVLLFTDLRGSTALYQEMGDARAYTLVRNHFGVLTKAISLHHGAVVKTIGDAVMAAFSRVDDALAAVQQCFQQLPAANPGLAAPLSLKSSLHVGPCLAVNANERLDYFGSTVNLAARMVECCEGGDLTMSDELYHRPETAKFFHGRLPAPEPVEISYRGFESPHCVWRIRMI